MARRLDMVITGLRARLAIEMLYLFAVIITRYCVYRLLIVTFVPYMLRFQRTDFVISDTIIGSTLLVFGDIK